MNGELICLWTVIDLLVIYSIYNRIQIGWLKSDIVKHDLNINRLAVSLKEFRETTTKNTRIIVRKVRINMATMNDLLGKIGELKPLVDAMVDGKKKAESDLVSANDQLLMIGDELKANATDQENLDMAVAMIDELKTVLSPPKN